MPGCCHVMGSLLQVLSVYVLAHQILVSLSCFVYLFFIEIISFILSSVTLWLACVLAGASWWIRSLEL